MWDREEIVIGRAHHEDRFMYSPYVSRDHISIIVRGSKITIRDLYSTNGTKVAASAYMHEPEKEQGFIEKISKDIKEKVDELRGTDTRAIFDLAGKRNPDKVIELIRNVEAIIQREAWEGRWKLTQPTISEICKGINGSEYFVNGKVAYLPPKGKAIFVGDVHGDSKFTEAIIRQSQFIEKVESSDTYLVFLGDYADRGKQDIRNLEIVLALKEKYPNNVVLLMGNHEEYEISRRYGLFRSLEYCFPKTGSDLFEQYHRLFRQLPNVVVAGNGVVGVHGGVTRGSIDGLTSLRNNEELFEQIRWSDPSPNPNINIGPSQRGYAYYTFTSGKGVFDKFMNKIGGTVMVRSHEVEVDGYKLFFDNRFVTVFSNGGRSDESGYKGRCLYPKYLVIPLNEPITQINPRKHVFDIK